MTVDYYAVLGLEADADLETLKASYRQLVRENHPDIAADKAAANLRMAEILEAWRVLSDPERRARYDADRRKHEARVAAATPVPAVAPKPRAATPANYGARQKGQRSSRSNNPKARLLEQVNRAAHLYYQEGRAADAMTLCQRVLKSDSKNLEATILLGDIYNAQSNAEMALVMYDRALILQPHNLLVRNKREKLRPTPANVTPVGTQVPRSPISKPVVPRDVVTTPAPAGNGDGRSLFARLKSKLKG